MEPSGCAEQLLSLKTSVERLRRSVNDELDSLSAVLDTLARKQNDLNGVAPSKHTTEAQLRKKSAHTQDLPEKIFAIRESRIVDIMANEHIRTVFNIFVAFLFMVSVILVTSYLYDPERLQADMSTIVVNSTGILGVFGHLVAVNLGILFLVHPSLQLWAHCRALGKAAPVDAIFGSLFAVFLGCVTVFPARYIFVNELPPLSACILAFEQVRLLMKSYAYTREIIGRVLKYAELKAKSENNHVELTLPGLSCVLYFLFAPTLVYRDSYPRTPRVRWGVVLWYLGQFLACVLMYSVVLNHFIKDLFCDAGKEDFQLLGFTLTGCSILLLGSISMFLVFYGFLHCWLNIFAEAMRFGDRLFYLDWWNSTTYADYYRSWNLVVHDWLFNYVYRDAYKLFNYNKKRAMLVVFFLSALVHEYILALSYRFFFPVILVVYGTFGVGLMFATKKKTAHFWNVFLWITLISGWGMILIFYTVEYYSRINCPSTKDGLADFFFPRSFSWSCNSFSHSIWFSSSFYKQKPPSLT